MRRSVNTECNLDPGIYDVRMKITAVRDENLPTIDQMVHWNVKYRKDKLFETALSYDLAHAKCVGTQEK